MPGVEQSVLYMKVTDALRAASPATISELAKTYNIADFPNLLILAVELSPYETVAWVIKLYLAKNRDVNEIDSKTGNTALHFAVENGRAPVVRDLMAIITLDDSIRNRDGLTALDLSSDPEMEAAISQAENKYAEEMSIRLKRAFKDRNLAQLEQIYANPRVSQLLNINGIDPETGRTVLHDSAQANDANLVRFILAHGGDPMIKDRKTHKLPQELTSSGDIQMQLNNAAKSRAIMDRTNADHGATAERTPPTMEGYLKKWTNLTSGYKLRYFSLKNGKLSYYKKPEDMKRHRSERGSISLRWASVRLDSSEKNKFEIYDEHKNRFFLKAAHPADTNKWVWVLKDAIMYSRDLEKAKARRKSTTGSTTSSIPAGLGIQRKSVDDEAGSVHTSINLPASSPANSGSDNALHKPADAANQATSPRGQAVKGPFSVTSQAPLDNQSTESNIGHKRVQSTTGSLNEFFVNDLGPKGVDDEDYDSDDDDESDDVVLKGPQISAESIIARLSAIKDLMTMLVFQVQDETMRDAITTVQGSIDVLSSDIVMLQRQSKAHLRKANQELERGEKNQRMWASNYRDLEMQYEKLEGEAFDIRKQLGAQESEDDEFFDTFDNAPTAAKGDNAGGFQSIFSKGASAMGLRSSGDKTSHREETSKLDQSATGASSQNAFPNGEKTLKHPDAVLDPSEAPDNSSTAKLGDDGIAGAGASAAVAGTAATGIAVNAENFGPAEDSKATTNKDEDAAMSTSKEQQKENHDLTVAQQDVVSRMSKEKSFAGYEKPPRTRLKIDADNRPRLSLWGILKNLIGKDMTKMTLPVTFNECTSLLQRSAEDMEYVDLLDRAAEAVDDPGLRMVYVAAFAGSSYSSTINRVAKPFNPLLGETYEYARPDCGYRLFAEQVSHHPPIGALLAESKNWDFYGESNVESKFYGRSFDINPLGLWYLNLRPDKGADTEEELYSFRKLTSSVVGIMVGNPVVDNYGDMNITNHTLGIHAKISYKARGWRGSSAYKLQGKITDKNGTELWTIAGQWNDKMWGMKSGSDEKILLWEAHPRHKTPFNLTDFAITLNDLPDELRDWLPPTDTRLRPDQRAMEEGRYDDASDDKSRVEEKQRAARREREAKGIQYKPQWFELVKHPVTGLDYYKPINNYWKQRADKNLADKGDIF